MKTAKDYIAEYSNGWDKIYTATAESMMQEYARQVAEEVKKRCIDVSADTANIKKINVSQFIK